MSWSEMIQSTGKAADAACEDERVRRIANAVGPKALGAAASAAGGPAVGKAVEHGSRALVAANENGAARFFVGIAIVSVTPIIATVLLPAFICSEVIGAISGRKAG